MSRRAETARVPNLKMTMGVLVVVTGTLLIVAADRVRVPSVEPLSAEAFSDSAAPRWEVVELERLPRGGELRERLALFDPSPLFLPTADKAGREVDVEGLAGTAVANYPPAMRYTDMAPARELFQTQAMLREETTARALAEPRWFEGMTRADEPLPAGAGVATVARAARVDVYRAGEAERVVGVDLVRAEGLVGVTWRPMELSVWVAETGTVAAPVVVTSSGLDETDERIRWIVARELLPTLLLRPGVYRLEVGP